jgi:hypothetical protein
MCPIPIAGEIHACFPFNSHERLKNYLQENVGNCATLTRHPTLNLKLVTPVCLCEDIDPINKVPFAYTGRTVFNVVLDYAT